MMKIDKRYLTFSELQEKWGISLDQIHYLIQEETLVPAIAWNGYVRSFTWTINDKGESFLSLNTYETKMLINGWLFLRLPVPNGNCNYKFSYLSNSLDTKRQNILNEDWYRLLDDYNEVAKVILNRDYIELHAVFMKEVIRDVELSHFGIDSDFEHVNKIQKLDTNHIPYTTDLLELQNLAINQFFSPRKIQDAKSEEVCEWIKNKGKELNLNVSTNVADAIFTIIKPYNHNPKIKRVKP